MHYIGLDVHKKECQAAILDEQGELVREMRIQTSKDGFLHLLSVIDNDSELVLEASSSFYPPYDFFSKKGVSVKVAHPTRLRAISSAKVKTDRIDAKILGRLLRANMIPEVHVPERQIRDLRELLRHREGLVRLSTQAKNRVQSLLTRRGIRHSFSDLFGKGGMRWLESIELDEPGAFELSQNLETIKHLESQIALVEQKFIFYEKMLPEARLLQSIKGMGRLSSLKFMAAVERISRFPDAKKLSSYAGLIPGVRQSGDKRRDGRITKEGSTLLRDALVTAATSAIRWDPKSRRIYERIEKRRGGSKAKVALARKIGTWAYFMLTRGEEYAS